MSKRILSIGIPLAFVLLALVCLIRSNTTLSTIFSAFSFVSTLVIFIISSRGHEREMARIYAEKQERDTAYLERMAEIMSSRSAR